MKDKKMFVKPATGRMVRIPLDMRPLSEKGENVPDNLYWRRLLNNGDVIQINHPSDMALEKEE